MIFLQLVLGVVVALLALLVVVFFVIAPPPPRVAAERRRAPGVEHVSVLTRVTERTSQVIDRAVSGRRSRFFSAESLEMAGVKTEPSGFIILVASAASVLALIGVIVGLSSGWSLLLGIVFALFAPFGARILLGVLTSRRRSKFADQVDDTVQLIAGGLRAGHGLNRTVAAVATDADAPMSEELARVVNETRLGRELADSLALTAERMQSDDFNWVAQAIAINAETGGNLAEVLDQVGKTIRERNQIRRQVRALSAEGRLSGIILVGLPIGVFLFLSVIRPEYVATFFNTVLGIIALIVAVLLLIIGTVWMAFTVRVKF